MQIRSTISPHKRLRFYPSRLLPFAVAVTWIVTACGSQGQQLNSERIAHAFGSYGVDVIQQSEGVRFASLYSGAGDDKVTRTLALVKFRDRGRPAFAREHAAVEAGQSLGAVFRSAGWTIEKHNIFIGELAVPEHYSVVSELMQIGLPEDLATHVYLFVISNDEGSFNYATIVELHHPDYLTAEDLRNVYGEIIFDDSNRTGIDDFIDPELWKN